MFLINDLKAYLYVMQICDYDEYTFESSRYGIRQLKQQQQRVMIESIYPIKSSI